MHIRRLQHSKHQPLDSFAFALLAGLLLTLTSPGCGKVTLETDTDGGNAMCGNDTVEGQEECDDGGESAACNANCTVAVCGDGIHNPTAGEQCDGPAGPNVLCDNCILTCAEGRDSCVEGQEPCSTDVWSDTEHCGWCNNPCPAGVPCIDGMCGGNGPPKTVFVSRVTMFGDFGGAFQADNLCQGYAAQAGLPGQYMAWISDTDTSPSQRFNQSTSPYILVDGTVIAQNWQDLTDGLLNAPINLNEYGDPVTGGNQCEDNNECRLVFTGTDMTGRHIADPNADCAGWSHRNNLPGYAAGHLDFIMEDWTIRSTGFRCDFRARLYCFEQ